MGSHRQDCRVISTKEARNPTSEDLVTGEQEEAQVAGSPIDPSSGNGDALSTDNAPVESQASKLVGLAAHAELFHDSVGDPFASVEVDGHSETHPIRSRAFRNWLLRQYYLA